MCQIIEYNSLKTIIHTIAVINHSIHGISVRFNHHATMKGNNRLVIFLISHSWSFLLSIFSHLDFAERSPKSKSSNNMIVIIVNHSPLIQKYSRIHAAVSHQNIHTANHCDSVILFLWKIKLFHLFNNFVQEFFCELIRMLIRNIKVKRIHWQSHWRMCNHWKLSHIDIRIISISFFVCSRSNNNCSFSESFHCVMKCWITSKQRVSITKRNNSTHVWGIKNCTSCKLWLSLTNYKSDFKS